MNNKERQGRFTSSMVYKLIPFGKVKMTPEELKEFKINNPKSRVTMKQAGFLESGKTYIQEKIHERRFKSCLDSGAYSTSMAWGNLMEMYVYSILGTEYQIASKQTLLHPKYKNFWSGSVDMYVEDKGKVTKVSEIKCYQKSMFAKYVDCMKKKDIELFKAEFPKEYWQIVSNACIHDCNTGEAVAFMPYISQYNEVVDLVESFGLESGEAWKYRFIVEKDIRELPFLPDDGYYDNINKFEFEIPKSDKYLLENRLLEASKPLLDAKV